MHAALHLVFFFLIVEMQIFCISFADYATGCTDTMVRQRVNWYLRRCDSCCRCLAHPPPVRAQVQGRLCTYPLSMKIVKIAMKDQRKSVEFTKSANLFH